jgi:hypothetical protein
MALRSVESLQALVAIVARGSPHVDVMSGRLCGFASSMRIYVNSLHLDPSINVKVVASTEVARRTVTRTMTAPRSNDACYDMLHDCDSTAGFCHPWDAFAWFFV